MSTPPSPQAPPKPIHTTEIVVREVNQIHQGRNAAGREWKIFQLIATNRDGQLIDLNLRSFSELPLNQLIKVDVEKYDSDRFGQSYTVSLHGKSKGGGLGKKVDELRARVDAQDEKIKKLEGAIAALRQQPSGTEPQAASVPTQRQVPPSVGGGLPDDQDIPF